MDGRSNMKKIVRIIGVLFVTVLIVIFIIYWIAWGSVVFNRVIIWTKPNVEINEIKYCADDRPYAKVKITEQEIQYDVVFYNVKYRTFILKDNLEVGSINGNTLFTVYLEVDDNCEKTYLSYSNRMNFNSKKKLDSIMNVEVTSFNDFIKQIDQIDTYVNNFAEDSLVRYDIGKNKYLFIKKSASNNGRFLQSLEDSLYGK